MDDEAMKAMARRIAASLCYDTPLGRAVAAEYISGIYDESSEVQAALAAIIETQARDES